MDFLEAMVYILVLYIAVLIPLAWLLWEYVRPWVKSFWKDWKAFRKQRRIERKIAEHMQWKESQKCAHK